MYNKLVNKEARLALVGLGYVGLPIALEFAKRISVIGFDINEDRLAKMRQGVDPCKELDHAAFEEADIKFTSSIDELREASFFIVAEKRGLRGLRVNGLPRLYRGGLLADPGRDFRLESGS